MAKGYPSKRRAKKAFEAGYLGRAPRTPYANACLIKLWGKGKVARKVDELSSPQLAIDKIRKFNGKRKDVRREQPRPGHRAGGRRFPATPERPPLAEGRKFPGWGGARGGASGDSYRNPRRRGGGDY